MSIQIDLLRRSVDAGQLRITDHADEEMAADRFVLTDVLESLRAGEIIEHYPSDHPLPSCLVYGQTTNGDHVHSVWAYNDVTTLAILVTVYRPDPERWIDWRVRREQP